MRRFGKSFRKVVRCVLKLDRNGEEEEVDLSVLLMEEGGVRRECGPLTEEEVEQWTMALRGIVEVGEGEGEGVVGEGGGVMGEDG